MNILLNLLVLVVGVIVILWLLSLLELEPKETKIVRILIVAIALVLAVLILVGKSPLHLVKAGEAPGVVGNRPQQVLGASILIASSLGIKSSCSLNPSDPALRKCPVSLV